MHRELGSFVDVDEKVREELNRKPRVEDLRERNQAELQKSFDKVKTSLSPKHSARSASRYYDGN